MNILALKKSNKNIQIIKRTKNSIWESLFIFASTITAGVEKILIWVEKLQKNLELLGNVREKTVQESGKFVRHRQKFEIPRLEILRGFYFDQVLNDQGTG